MTSSICGIYCIRNITSDKRYIGSSRNIAARWRVHRCRLSKNKHHSDHLQKSYNISGADHFAFEILEIVSDTSQLETREQFWVDHFQSFKSEFGYNAVRTVQINNPQRMKERWAKPGAKEEQSKRMKEICSTPEHRKKLSEGHVRFFADPKARHDKMMASPLRKAVYCPEKDETYPSINAAAKALGVSIVKIRDSISGKRKSKTYSFKLVEDNEQQKANVD